MASQLGRARLSLPFIILAVLSLSASSQTPGQPRPQTGAEVLAATQFRDLAGLRVGLITNHTGQARGEPIARLLSQTPRVSLAAIFAPEHGLRGAVEAGAKVGHERDGNTGVPVFSLYGATKRPTREMLRDVDALVFDIQDIGARFYTYISTMGLAMQAAAAAHVPFIVLDRPNPLGGTYVSGFVLEPALRSFVGSYPIPIVHGMTVGELARMIKGEAWLDGLEDLDLRIVRLEGWQRSARWPATGIAWVPTSPNIQTFAAALVYPGMGIVGEANVSVGLGTETPFLQFGAPWLDAARLMARLSASALQGVALEPATFTPHAVAGVASRPRYLGETLRGTRIVVTDVERFEPLEAGMHVLCAVAAEARGHHQGAPLIPDPKMLRAMAGTARLETMLEQGSDARAIIAAWRDEVASFRARRARYLLY
jgi:uncharacterized protein YbbC (DUF1343 family)